MYRSKITNCILLLLLGLGIPLESAAESPNDILIIVNKGAPVDAATIEELKQIFLGKKESWKNGDRIVALNQFNNTPLRRSFRERVLNMTPKEEATYWENQKVRRQLKPPPELASITKAVFKLKNSISYAYRKDVPSNVVKVLLVIPE